MYRLDGQAVLGILDNLASFVRVLRMRSDACPANCSSVHVFTRGDSVYAGKCESVVDVSLRADAIPANLG